jgi:hypothetical protein
VKNVIIWATETTYATVFFYSTLKTVISRCSKCVPGKWPNLLSFGAEGRPNLRLKEVIHNTVHRQSYAEIWKISIGSYGIVIFSKFEEENTGVSINSSVL